ncbi:dTMP kinase [Lentzea sp. NPDC058450]|uniref:dTMP kinase n=1 Tax=Lentzea sp. NPDC058450 TaxID=3346505 RepID=UPI00365C0AEC
MFIALEGIDGAGKSITAAAVAARLRQRGEAVRLVRHNAAAPDDPFVAEYLGGLRALQEMSLRGPYFRLGDPHWVLIRASYYALVDRCVITPALERGQVVVADGWFHKFVARVAAAGVREKGDFDRPEQILPLFAPVRLPDRVFLLDTPVATAAARRMATVNPGELGPQNAGTGSPEQAFVRYQSDVRGHLLAMAGRWRVVRTAGRDVSGVAAEVCADLDVLRETG